MNIKKITEAIGAARELIELITKIGEETNNLQLQKAILELDKKNYLLEKEILELKKELDKREQFNMQFMKNFYWNIKEDGKKEGPYCPACWDGYDRPTRLQTEQFGYSCPVCVIKKHTK